MTKPDDLDHPWTWQGAAYASNTGFGSAIRRERLEALEDPLASAEDWQALNRFRHQQAAYGSRIGFRNAD